MGCCLCRQRNDDAADRALRAVLCATDLQIDANMNAGFLNLLSNSNRLPQEETRLYMMAKEIIIVSGLDPTDIRPTDHLRIAAALVALERQL